MEYTCKMLKMLSNLSGNRIHEIKLVSNEIGGYDVHCTYYVKGSIKVEIVGILFEEEKNSFIEKLSEHGWYTLYKGIAGASRRYQERYFHVTEIERINFRDSAIHKIGHAYYILEIGYKNAIICNTCVIFNDPINQTQQAIDSFEKAGRFDLLLKL